jgi:tRNA splicing endonuclease
MHQEHNSWPTQVTRFGKSTMHGFFWSSTDAGPLHRFHSHFLVNGMDWDEEFDLLSLTAQGRLATGVKKSYLIGGEAESDTKEEQCRAFCVEWAGM